jgi:uncharacterized protein
VSDVVSAPLLDRVVYAAPDRLRAVWRIVLFLLAGFAASNVAVPLIATMLPAGVLPWIKPALECGAVLVATWYASHSLEQTGWSFVALHRSAWQPRPLLLGTLAGALAIALPTGVLIGLGDLTFVADTDRDVVRMIAMSIAVLAPAAMIEELLMRGYPFAVLQEHWGRPMTVAVTSVVFGVLHLGNPGVTPLAIANVIAAGVFLAGVRLVTRSLAAAWAAHFAWNWTMSAGFHTAVSGLPFDTPGYRLVDSGPDWLSGGLWGPEGGALAGVGMIAAFSALYWSATRTRSGASALIADVAVHSRHIDGAVRHQEHHA